MMFEIDEIGELSFYIDATEPEFDNTVDVTVVLDEVYRISSRGEILCEILRAQAND